MAKCWTCGASADAPTYTCPSCEDSCTLEVLRREAEDQASAEGPAVGLRHAQDRGAGELRDAMLSISRVSLANPEWRGVMTRMLDNRGLTGLGSGVRWGFGELGWQAEQETEVLASIDATLRTPGATQSEEWRLMAEELRRRGVLDESEEFYLKAIEVNRLDYRLYVGLAETYIRASRFDEARGVLERSLPHAPTSDIDYRSHSYRLLGHVHECEGDCDSAVDALEKAVAFSPSYTEAHYDLAQYAAQAGQAEKSLTALRAALEARPSYCYLAAVEPNLDPIRADVDDLLEELRSGAWRTAAEALAEAEDDIATAAAAVADAERAARERGEEPAAGPADPYAAAVAMMEQARAEALSGDYITLLGAVETARAASEKAAEARDEARSELTGVRESLAALAEADAAARAYKPNGRRDRKGRETAAPTPGEEAMPEANVSGATAESLPASPALCAEPMSVIADDTDARDEDPLETLETTPQDTPLVSAEAPETADLAAAVETPQPGRAAVVPPQHASAPAPAAVASAAPAPASAPRRAGEVLLGGLKTAAVLTPIAAFVFAVLGFLHGSMVLSLDNLDAPFVYLWSYVSRGTAIVCLSAFALGVYRSMRAQVRLGVAS